MKHARLSPSSSSRWLTCTSSVEMSERYKGGGNDSAKLGTAIHEIGEMVLRGHTIPSVVEGLEVTDEMQECATEYATYVKELVNDDSIVLIEEQFNLSSISKGQFGTSDATILNGTHLHVIDLKTGFNIVNAESNTQMMLYAIGAVDDLEVIYDIKTITLHIVQTRAGHVDTWDLNYEDLMKFKAYAQTQAKAIVEGGTKFNPSTKACQWCLHKVNCEALKNHVDEVVTGSFDNLEELEGNADKVSIDHMKKILDNSDLILGFVKAVKEVALERMEAGEDITGYKLVESKTNRKWVDEDLVKSHLMGLKDDVDYYNHKLLPMTQLLKLRKDDEKLQELLIKPQGRATLVASSDKRQAISQVSDDFDEI